MNKKTLKALEESIAHWERMRDDPDCGEEPSGTDCPLCARFGGEERCYGCPVYDRTLRRNCEGSPLADAVVARYLAVRASPADKFVAVAEWRRQATREIQFLRSLLPAPAKEIKP